MTTLVDQVNRRFTWEQLEQIVLTMPLSLFVAARQYGVSEESGCLHARSLLCDHLRKQIAQLAADEDQLHRGGAENAGG